MWFRLPYRVLYPTQITYFLLKICHVSCSQLSRSTCIPCGERWNWEPSTISGFDSLMVGTIDTINDYCISTTKFMDKFALTNMLVACFWAISLTHKNACFFNYWIWTLADYQHPKIDSSFKSKRIIKTYVFDFIHKGTIPFIILRSYPWAHWLRLITNFEKVDN